MSTDPPTLKALSVHVTQLKLLLDHPEPGLLSWQELFRARLRAITAFWLSIEGTPDERQLLKEIEGIVARIKRRYPSA